MANTDLQLTVTITLNGEILSNQTMASNKDILDLQHQAEYLMTHRIWKVTNKAVAEAVSNYKKLWKEQQQK